MGRLPTGLESGSVENRGPISVECSCLYAHPGDAGESSRHNVRTKGRTSQSAVFERPLSLPQSVRRSRIARFVRPTRASSTSDFLALSRLNLPRRSCVAWLSSPGSSFRRSGLHASHLQYSMLHIHRHGPSYDYRHNNGTRRHVRQSRKYPQRPPRQVLSLWPDHLRHLHRVHGYLCCSISAWSDRPG
jgi:hypothetical protein